jgi:hypothetical protein
MAGGYALLPGDPTTPPPYPEARSFIRKVVRGQIEVPKSLKDLDSGEIVSTYQFSVDMALALELPIGSTEAKFARKIFIQEYSNFREITDNDQKLRYGIAIRWIANIKMLDVKANISSMPFVAASAQFGHVEASARFQVVGISSHKITQLMPNPANLDLESYVEMKNALTEIKKLIWDSETKVTPQPLAVFGEISEREEEKYEEAIAVAYTLNCIREGKKLLDTLRLTDDKSDLFKNVAQSIYHDITKNSEINVKPSEESRKEAERLLYGFSVKHRRW